MGSAIDRHPGQEAVEKVRTDWSILPQSALHRPFVPPAIQPIVFNTLRPRQNGRHFADDTFKRIFLNENVWNSIKISMKFVLKGPINNIPSLVQIMAWRRPGDKPLSEPMMVSLLTHICVTRPQGSSSYVVQLLTLVSLILQFHLVISSKA